MNQSGQHPNSRAAVSQSNRERAAAARRERELRARTPYPTPHLDAARAELASGPRLVVESLEEKLARLVPGAYLVDTRVVGSVVRYEVRQAGEYTTRVIADGASAREAADRAVFLWGAR